MPELPEVETVCRALAPPLLGRSFLRIEARRKNLRAPLPQNFTPCLNTPITAITRRAKYILIHLANRTVILLHLGMSGRLLFAKGALEKHDHVIFDFGEKETLRFNDARRFGILAITQEKELAGSPFLGHLGPEPLDPALTATQFYAALAKRKGPLKPALMDQRLIVGVGNIYASEALFRAGLHPARAANTLSLEETRRLLLSIRAVLRAAIKAGGSTLQDYRQPSGEAGYFHTRFAVYDRTGQACRSCDCDVKKTGGIRRTVQAGRATFWCPQKQALPNQFSRPHAKPASPQPRKKP